MIKKWPGLLLIAAPATIPGCGPPGHRIASPDHTHVSIEVPAGKDLVATFASLKVGTPVEVVDRPPEHPGHWRVRPLDGDHKGEVVWVRAEDVAGR